MLILSIEKHRKIDGKIQYDVFKENPQGNLTRIGIIFEQDSREEEEKNWPDKLQVTGHGERIFFPNLETALNYFQNECLDFVSP